MTTQNTITSDMAIVYVNIHQWSGRCTIKATDLPQDVLQQLPPQEVASFGQKRLFPQQQLGVFDTIRTSTHKFLAGIGTRFLGGYAVDARQLGEIRKRLDTFQNVYLSARSELLATYTDTVLSWQSQFPQWATILQEATPTPDEVAEKYSFEYQTYTVSGTSDNSLADAVAALPSQAASDLSQEIQALLNTTFSDTRKFSTFSRKSLNPLVNLLNHVRGLCFLNSQYTQIAALLEHAFNVLSADCQNATNILTARAILLALSNPAEIDRIATQVEFFNIGDVWSGFIPQNTVTVAEQEEDNAENNGIDTENNNTETVEALQNAACNVSATMLIDSMFTEI